jgi:hypothetical protein
VNEGQGVFRRVLRDGRRALSDRLSDKHVARLVQGLALAVISAAASASTGSKPPACQSAGGAVSSPVLLFNPARHQVRAICAVGSWGGQGWSVRRHPGDVFAAFVRSYSRCQHRCWPGWSSATGHRRSRAGTGFPAAGPGAPGSPAPPVVDPSLPARGSVRFRASLPDVVVPPYPWSASLCGFRAFWRET